MTRCASFGRRCVGVCEHEAHQLLTQRPLLQDSQAALAHEERLVHTERPRRADLERIRQAIGVLADDDVSLLQTQHSLGFDAERADAVALACFHQGVPHARRFSAGQVDFVTELADEADAQQAASHAGDVGFAHAEIGKRRVRRDRASSARQALSGTSGLRD